MSEPPEPGTPLESVMFLIWRMRQDAELQKVRVITQAIIAAASDGEDSNKALREAWDDLKDALYPYHKGSRKRSDEVAMEYFKKEAARGPLKVIPLQPVGRRRSKLKTRYIKRQG